MMDDPKKLLARLHKSEQRLALSIGQFVMRFADMERAINRGIGVLLNLDHKLYQLITGPIINVNVRLDILQSLVNGCDMPRDLRKRFESAIQRARKLNDDRNWVVHDSWGAYMVQSDEWQKIKSETKAKFRLKGRTYSPTKIDQKARDSLSVEVEITNAATEYAKWRNAPKS